MPADPAEFDLTGNAASVLSIVRETETGYASRGNRFAAFCRYDYRVPVNVLREM